MQLKLGSAMVLVALVASVGGVAWSPNETSTITTTLTNITGQMGRGDFVLPIVDRNGLTGKNLRLSDLRGKVIALEFMEPWCPPCQQSVPFMESLYQQYANRGVVFIAVAEPWDPVRNSHYQNVTITQFLGQYSSNLTYAYDSTGQVTSLYGVESVPTLFVLSKTGAVGENYGWLVGSDLISQHASVAIETLLAQVVVVITSQTSVLTSNLQILIIVIVIAVAISVAAAFLLGKKREASA